MGGRQGPEVETALFLQGGLLDSLVIASSSLGFALPSPSEAARVNVEGGSWTWPKALACLPDLSSGTCLLHSL